MTQNSTLRLKPQTWTLWIVLWLIPLSTWSVSMNSWAQSHSSPQKSDTFDLTERFKEGLSYYKKQDYNISAAIFLTILKAYPGHIGSHLYLALSYNKIHEYEKSHILFLQLHKRGYLKTEYFFEAGYAAIQLNRFQEAALFFKKVPQTQQNYDIAMYYAGVCEYNLGHRSSAKNYLKQAVVLPKALADNKTELLKKMEYLATLKTQTHPKKSSELSPQDVMNKPPKKSKKITQTRPSSRHTLELMKPHMKIYLRSWNDFYWPVYTPPQDVNFSFSLIEGGFKADNTWFQFDRSRGLGGVSVELGSRYTLDYLNKQQGRALIQPSPYLDDRDSDTRLGAQGIRHDNLSFFIGFGPFVQWVHTQRFSVGTDSFVRGYYGQYNDNPLVTHLRASPYGHVLISDRVQASLRLQVDSLIPMSESFTSSHTLYGAVTEIDTKIDPSFGLKVSGSAQKVISHQRSSIETFLITSSMVIEWLLHPKLKLKGGALYAHHHKYQIWPTDQASPFQSHINNFSAVTGVSFKPFHDWHISAQTSASQFLHSPLEPLELTQWQAFAPTFQNYIHFAISWNHKLNHH